MKGLYIHIPFCKTICSYCDFPKIVAKENIHNIYVNRLIEEFDAYQGELKNIDTVYLGGGTPNSIDLKLLEKILIKCSTFTQNAKESTIELNPELVTEKLVILLKKYNINRVSLGVQTINENAKRLLNRHHTKEDVINAISLFNKYEISNINVDLMFGIPNTSIDDVKCDLQFILNLNVKHISYYSLILEEKTVLEHRLNKKEISLLDDDIISNMYNYISNRLITEGFHHYEISNFARYGYESIHNMLYWNCDSYIGLGAGACGYLNNVRYENNKTVNKYLKDFKLDEIEISEAERKKEYFLLGLRLVDGVSINKYKELFNSDPFVDFNLEKLINKKLIEVNGDNIKISNDKLFIGNLVFEEFVGD
ncbi:MAG: radical SAM family heme chaperone HemW [Erysipelotrichaceae bacterium]|nr:radical SAM family heme chaperone HemW [Erysipelotrichaceae bacterium]